MAYNYGPLQATATKLLTKFGRSAAIVRRAVIGGAASSPVYAETIHPCTVVLGTFTGMERANSNIAATDIKVMAAPLDIDIGASDMLLMDGHRYDIVDPMPLMPGGVVILWEFGARR